MRLSLRHLQALGILGEIDAASGNRTERGNVQGFWNIYMGTTSSGPLVSCSGFSWATCQWVPESWEIQECLLSTVGGESHCTKRGCLMTYLRSLTTFNTFRFARAGWENWANWAQLEVLLPERSPWTPWLQTILTVHTLPSDSFQLE